MESCETIFRVETTESKPMMHAKTSESMVPSVSSIEGVFRATKKGNKVSDMVSDKVCATSARLAH